MITVASLFTFVCSALLPVTIVLILCLQKKGYWKPVLFGAITFFVFQILIRIPILQLVLPQMDWYLKLQASDYFLYSIFLGSTAALFEEVGRFVVIKLFLKKHHTFTDGLAFGIGHGGIEALLFAGINSLVVVLLSYQSQVTASSMFAGGFERLFAMLWHIAFTLMVFRSIRGTENDSNPAKKGLSNARLFWFIAALVSHFLLDAVTVYAMYLGASILMIEVGLAISCILPGSYIYWEYRNQKIKSDLRSQTGEQL